LCATDSWIEKKAEALLGKVSIGPFWNTASKRSYHAQLAVQILDTNAVPALVDSVIIIKFPHTLHSGDSAVERVWALTLGLGSVVSVEAKAEVQERLGAALDDPDPHIRRNAAVGFGVGLVPNPHNFGLLLKLTTDTSPQVRSAALGSLFFSKADNDAGLKATISRLADDQAAIRLQAVAAIAWRGSNAIAAVPALRTAYAAEPHFNGPREWLDGPRRTPPELSVRAIQEYIEKAIRRIDPSAPLPP
jgi:HEAT repeat protein